VYPRSREGLRGYVLCKEEEKEKKNRTKYAEESRTYSMDV